MKVWRIFVEFWLSFTGASIFVAERGSTGIIIIIFIIISSNYIKQFLTKGFWWKGRGWWRPVACLGQNNSKASLSSKTDSSSTLVGDHYILDWSCKVELQGPQPHFCRKSVSRNQSLLSCLCQGSLLPVWFLVSVAVPQAPKRMFFSEHHLCISFSFHIFETLAKGGQDELGLSWSVVAQGGCCKMGRHRWWHKWLVSLDLLFGAWVGSSPKAGCNFRWNQISML